MWSLSGACAGASCWCSAMCSGSGCGASIVVLVTVAPPQAPSAARITGPCRIARSCGRCRREGSDARLRAMRIMILAAVVVVVAASCGREPVREQPEAAMVAACTAKGKDLACPRPILYVGSLEAAQRYYRDKLGFHIDWTDG